MAQRNEKEKTWFGTGNIARAGVAALFMWSTTIYPVLAETAAADGKLAQAETTPPPAKLPEAPPAPAMAQDAPVAPPAPAAAEPAPPHYSVTELQYLLGPIALYPDTLLALIMPAAMDPLQLIHAENWIYDNPEDVKKGDFSGADALGLDAAVVALMRFPDVIEMMNDHIDWTESLGTAFSNQPGDVAAVIQMLRAQAEQVGNLRTTPQQTVTVREESGQRTIYVAPANPERIYVPVYDSSTVFTTAATTALVFGAGIIVGSAWNNSWGWNNRGWNNRGWNNVWVQNNWYVSSNRNNNRPGRPAYRPGAWRPDRPNSRPDRPGNRPGRPNARPDGNGRPDRPGMRPDRPGNRPNGRPDRPGDRPNARPGERPNRPGNREGATGSRPNRPDRPATRPQTGERNRANNAGRPNTERRQNTRPQQSRPQQNQRQRPQNARPQQNQRPQNSRPQQQRNNRPQQGARPQQRPNNARPQQRPQQSRPQQNQRPQNARPQNQRPHNAQQQRNNRPQQGARPQNQRRGNNNCPNGVGQNGRCR